MKKTINFLVETPSSNILVDIYHKEGCRENVVLFCHGFKGFKDWGAWHLVAEKFADAGFVFIKFNFSHNGIGHEDVQKFSRLDLFEQNNYTKEINEAHQVVDWIYSPNFIKEIKIKPNKLCIIGHSRGGGIALLAALENDKIKKVATWASIANFDRFGEEGKVEQWKIDGTKNFYNSRTKQDMKVAYQFYEDFNNNKSRLNIENICKNLKKPLLIVHGKKDDSVGFSHAQRLKKWKVDAELCLIENANHVFGAKHPFKEEALPLDLTTTVDRTLSFLNK